MRVTTRVWARGNSAESASGPHPLMARTHAEQDFRQSACRSVTSDDGLWRNVRDQSVITSEAEVDLERPR
jgi:hypothetical protein